MNPNPFVSPSAGDESAAGPNPNQGEQVSEWVSTPQSSNVEGFQLFDRSASEYGASSAIDVQFKGKGGKPPSKYRYTFSKHDQARAVFEALKGADSVGHTVQVELKDKKVPYTRVF